MADFSLKVATEPKEKYYKVPGCMELIPEGDECSLYTRKVARKLKVAGLSNGFGSVRLNPILKMSLKITSKGEENASMI
jgi:hypothetical protein